MNRNFNFWVYNKNMKIFSEKHQELKQFEEIILDIEKEREKIKEYGEKINEGTRNKNK